MSMRNTQYTTHNTQHTAHNTQYGIHNTQNTIHNTQRAARLRALRRGVHSVAQHAMMGGPADFDDERVHKKNKRPLKITATERASRKKRKPTVKRTAIAKERHPRSSMSRCALWRSRRRCLAGGCGRHRRRLEWRRGRRLWLLPSKSAAR